MISVQTVVQYPVATADGAAVASHPGGPEQAELLHQQHRVAAGTTIRQLLRMLGFEQVASAIDAGRLGLAVYGKRAWLDDVLVDGSRVEVTAPIRADAKAARVARAAADRSRRRIRLSSAR
jgi:putative ubiquitin-RnfH superfamily antitoxin RatB of RatAB toxin-antitoxin module